MNEYEVVVFYLLFVDAYFSQCVRMIVICGLDVSVVLSSSSTYLQTVVGSDYKYY